MGVQYYEIIETMKRAIEVVGILLVGGIAAWAAIKIYLNQKKGGK